MKNPICIFMALCPVFVLGACGGGGGGGGSSGGSSGGNAPPTIFVTVDYSVTSAQLYYPTTTTPTFSGFSGLPPQCTLTSGAVAPGMTLNSNCSISGTPTNTGTYNFHVRVGAIGASNTIDTAGSLRVTGPSPFYPGHSLPFALSLGTPVNDSVNLGWIPPPGLVTSWTYTLTSPLSPGLTLNTTTGTVSGTPTTAGSFIGSVQATLTTSFGTYTPGPTNYYGDVSLPTFSYSDTGGTGTSGGVGGVPITLNAYVSQPFNATPTTTGTGTLSAFVLGSTPLPTGLTLNTSSGVISGTPTVAPTSVFSTTSVALTATITSGALSNPISGSTLIDMKVPVMASYTFETPAHVGTPITVSPNITQISPISTSAATFLYVQRPPGDCTVPPGLALNATTGVVAGTPTSTGFYSCFVDVTITNNAVSWTSTTQFNIIVN